MKKFILDVSKWRSGGFNIPNCSTGKGDITLRNSEGYMCVLGQYLLQNGYTERDILGQISITDLKNIYLNTDCSFLLDETGNYHHSSICHDIMNINDDTSIDASTDSEYIRTTEEKIEALKAEFAKVDITLEVINYNPSLESNNV